MISLEQWREQFSYHPWHFWQMATNEVAGLEVTSACNSIVTEFAYQNDNSVGRSEIRAAIETAHDRLFEHLNYRAGQEYVTKKLQYPRPYDARMNWNYAADAQGRWLAVNAREGFIREAGVQAFEDLGEQAVVLSDQYGTGVDDTFTVTATVTAGTDPDQIELYFASSDRLDSEALSAKWRIEPIKVTVTGTTATIIGRTWLLVRPILYHGWAAPQLDLSNTTIFVDTVEVRRRYTDPDGITIDDAQATLIWETDPPYNCCPCISCTSDTPTFDPHSSDPAAEAMAIARVVIRDARMGELGVGQSIYDSTNDRFVAVNWNVCKPPDRVILRYRAGAEVDEVNSQIGGAGSWTKVVSRLAAAELAPFRICACDSANQQLHRWQFDRSRAAGANAEQYRISEADLANPLGTRAGHIYAWQRIRNLLITRARSI